jgi:predicted N-formylglutamate amidohydrolase
MLSFAPIITCEHASNRLPPSYSISDSTLLETHEGYDIGALFYAAQLHASLKAPLFQGQYSRLLIDLNRSVSNRKIFSSYLHPLNKKERLERILQYYDPFRARVCEAIETFIKQGKTVLHISCHTFCPILKGQERRCDIGILYDPKRSLERAFAIDLRKKLGETSSMRLRLNAPYRGVSDGHVTSLRKKFAPHRYVGIELEINQNLFTEPICSTQVWITSLCREIALLCHKKI